MGKTQKIIVSIIKFFPFKFIANENPKAYRIDILLKRKVNFELEPVWERT